MSEILSVGALLRAGKTLKYATDAAPLLRIWYDGPLTYAKIAVAGAGPSTITGKADNTDGATTAAPWGTAGVITSNTAATDTLGEIADEINAYAARSGWHCDILGGRRATSIAAGGGASLVAAAAASCLKSAGGVNVLGSTAVVLVHGIRITNLTVSEDNRSVVNILNGVRGTLTGTTLTFSVYTIKGTTENLIWTSADMVGSIASGTPFTIDATDWGDTALRGDAGEDILVLAGGATLTAATMTCYYQSIGQQYRHALRSARQ